MKLWKAGLGMSMNPGFEMKLNHSIPLTCVEIPLKKRKGKEKCMESKISFRQLYMSTQT